MQSDLQVMLWDRLPSSSMSALRFNDPSNTQLFCMLYLIPMYRPYLQQGAFSSLRLGIFLLTLSIRHLYLTLSNISCKNADQVDYSSPLKSHNLNVVLCAVRMYSGSIFLSGGLQLDLSNCHIRCCF